MSDLESNFYRGKNNDTRVKRAKQPATESHIHTQSRQKIPVHDQEYDEIQSLKDENSKLKRMLKEAQTKRAHITKQCSQFSKRLEHLEQQNLRLTRKAKDDHMNQEGSQYRLDELRFLNKQLNNQIEQLRKDNEDLSQKIRYHTEILERKYEDLEQRTFKRIQQALKRIKKGIHYLGSLSAKEIQKTRDIQVDNLRKTVQVLKGKYSEDKYEEEIEELMNPIRNIQDELHQRNKELGLLKDENMRLQQEVSRHRRMQNELMPQYKQSIEKLKKSLAQMRGQLSDNEYQKCQLKKKYEQKIRELEIKHDELFKQHRKMKLENKIYEKKLQEMEADVEEEKDRLIEENQLLKKLYRSEDEAENSIHQNATDGLSYQTTTNFRKQDLSDVEGDLIGHDRPGSRGLRKNYSTNNLRNSRDYSRDGSRSRAKVNSSGRKNYDHLRHNKKREQLQISEYYNNENIGQNTSQLSQESLKNEIFKIDKQIMEIQRTLNEELQIYK